MSTLTTPPVSDLLDRLYAQADAADGALRKRLAAMSPEEKSAMLSQDDYKALYLGMPDNFLAVPRETGRLCYMLARASGARSMVEFGASYGLSAIYLASALRDNGGGRLVTSEFEPTKVVRAGENLAAAGLADLVEIREGDALDTLSRDLPDTIDFVLLDGAKELYVPIIKLLAPRMKPGALVVADNSDMCPDYVAHVRTPGGAFLSAPIAGNAELSQRL